MKRRDALGAAAIAAALLAGGAHAAGAIATSTQVTSATYLGGGNLYVPAFLDCPPGEVAVGGGANVSNPYFLTVRSTGATFDQFGFYSGPDGVRGAPDGWLGQATTAAVTTLRVGVACAPGAAVETAVVSTPMAVGSTSTATATCPAGSVAVSGGVQGGTMAVTILDFQPTYASGSLATMATGEGPAPNGWTATMRNDDIFERILKVAALCIPAGAATVTTQVGSVGVVGNDLGGGGVACPAGTVATGGALAAPEGASFSLIDNAPRIQGQNLDTVANGAQPPPDGWQSTVRNLGPTFVIANFGAICVPEPESAPEALAACVGLVAMRCRALRRRAA